ncbi:MAG TPA: hypothetical protein PL009_09585 [Flavipsychrobacter sp.]|nr:hypothetical protein [Flavipsychrobacter sp.]
MRKQKKIVGVRKVLLYLSILLCWHNTNAQTFEIVVRSCPDNFPIESVSILNESSVVIAITDEAGKCHFESANNSKITLRKLGQLDTVIQLKKSIDTFCLQPNYYAIDEVVIMPKDTDASTELAKLLAKNIQEFIAQDSLINYEFDYTLSLTNDLQENVSGTLQYLNLSYLNSSYKNHIFYTNFFYKADSALMFGKQYKYLTANKISETFLFEPMKKNSFLWRAKNIGYNTFYSRDKNDSRIFTLYNPENSKLLYKVYFNANEKLDSINQYYSFVPAKTSRDITAYEDEQFFYRHYEYSTEAPRMLNLVQSKFILQHEDWNYEIAFMLTRTPKEITPSVYQRVLGTSNKWTWEQINK